MALLPIPFSNPYTYAGHSGVDFPQNRGTAFRASGPGTVTSIDYAPRPGNTVWVQYDNGPLVGYAHMDKRTTDVQVRSRVQEGTILGRVGSLGTASTGPHLHVEVNGYATTAGFWRFFDRNRVVGASSGGGSGTLPGKDDDMDARQNMMLERLFQELLPGEAGVKTAGSQALLLAQTKTAADNANTNANAARVAAQSQVTDWAQGVAGQNPAGRLFSLLGQAAQGITDAQVKAIADAVIAQIGKPTVTVDYVKIANDVRAKFTAEPLTGSLA